MFYTLRWPLIALALLSLVACGPPRKSVFAPALSIQQLKVLPNGQWDLTVRIQNNSYGAMDFTAIDGQLQIADEVPLRLHSTTERNIPALVGDVITIEVLPTDAMSKLLASTATQGSAGSLAYSVRGIATATPEQEKSARTFEFAGKDRLSPVPGIAGTFR